MWLVIPLAKYWGRAIDPLRPSLRFRDCMIPANFTPMFFSKSFTYSEVTFHFSNVNPSHTLPTSSSVHARPSVLPKANGTLPHSSEGQEELIIPARDYGVPLNDLGILVKST